MSYGQSCYILLNALVRDELIFNIYNKNSINMLVDEYIKVKISGNNFKSLFKQ